MNTITLMMTFLKLNKFQSDILQILMVRLFMLMIFVKATTREKYPFSRIDCPMQKAAFLRTELPALSSQTARADGSPYKPW